VPAAGAARAQGLGPARLPGAQRSSRASRKHLAGLLFEDAEDPLAALRWNLSELRRLLGTRAARRLIALRRGAGHLCRR
jgi:hypothetical protein